MGPCARRVVRCSIVLAGGRVVRGENWCANPQPACPRAPGEGYEKCETVCRQEGHAEVVALRLAKETGAILVHAHIQGHTYACQSCQEALYGAGVGTVSVSPAPVPSLVLGGLQ